MDGAIHQSSSKAICSHLQTTSEFNVPANFAVLIWYSQFSPHVARRIERNGLNFTEAIVREKQEKEKETKKKKRRKKPKI